MYYHSIAQSRLRAAVDKEALPGMSRLHHDITQKMRGVWLSDDLNAVVQANHGLEKSDEVLAKIKIGDKEIVQMKPIIPIVLEVDDLDIANLYEHVVDPHQMFYNGDLPWNKVKRFLIRLGDPEAAKTARELALKLKEEKQIDIPVENFTPTREDFEGRELLKSFWEKESRL